MHWYRRRKERRAAARAARLILALDALRPARPAEGAPRTPGVAGPPRASWSRQKRVRRIDRLPAERRVVRGQRLRHEVLGPFPPGGGSIPAGSALEAELSVVLGLPSIRISGPARVRECEARSPHQRAADAAPLVRWKTASGPSWRTGCPPGSIRSSSEHVTDELCRRLRRPAKARETNRSDARIASTRLASTPAERSFVDLPRRPALRRCSGRIFTRREQRGLVEQRAKRFGLERMPFRAARLELELGEDRLGVRRRASACHCVARAMA